MLHQLKENTVWILSLKKYAPHQAMELEATRKDKKGCLQNGSSKGIAALS